MLPSRWMGNTETVLYCEREVCSLEVKHVIQIICRESPDTWQPPGSHHRLHQPQVRERGGAIIITDWRSHCLTSFLQLWDRRAGDNWWLVSRSGFRKYSIWTKRWIKISPGVGTLSTTTNSDELSFQILFIEFNLHNLLVLNLDEAHNSVHIRPGIPVEISTTAQFLSQEFLSFPIINSL